MEENFIRLYYKDNKEKITQIMRHLNPKYLFSLYKKAHKLQLDNWYDWYNENQKCNSEVWHELYKHARVTVKYDGYIFTVSLKTIKTELDRRIENNEITWDGWRRNHSVVKNIKTKKHEETNKKKRI